MFAIYYLSQIHQSLTLCIDSMQPLVYYRLVQSWFTPHNNPLCCIHVRGCCIKSKGVITPRGSG